YTLKIILFRKCQQEGFQSAKIKSCFSCVIQILFWCVCWKKKNILTTDKLRDKGGWAIWESTTNLFLKMRK
ncbi:hypothetical protein FRX31_006596, partial [Thalictrum thalictroides]